MILKRHFFDTNFVNDSSSDILRRPQNLKLTIYLTLLSNIKKMGDFFKKLCPFMKNYVIIFSTTSKIVTIKNPHD